MADRILRTPQVVAIIGLSSSTVYCLISSSCPPQ
jgi:predicted DNA-binding transcriptional regulator AlpA